MPPLVGVLERRGARRPRGTFAEALLAVPPSGAGPPAAASRSSLRSPHAEDDPAPRTPSWQRALVSLLPSLPRLATCIALVGSAWRSPGPVIRWGLAAGWFGPTSRPSRELVLGRPDRNAVKNTVGIPSVPVGGSRRLTAVICDQLHRQDDDLCGMRDGRECQRHVDPGGPSRQKGAPLPGANLGGRALKWSPVGDSARYPK